MPAYDGTENRMRGDQSGVTNRLSYLVVDDSPINLKWMANILQSIGPCDIEEASDGEEAIERLRDVGHDINAVITDLRMPKMNGLELLREVRLGRTDAPQSIPFFVVTGYAERAFAGLALGLDVDAFLARPVKKQALQRHIIRTCAERRAVKSTAEAQAIYGDIDLSLAALKDLETTEEPTPADKAPAAPNGKPADAGLIALAHVPEGAFLARDAVNSAGAVLLKAGEEITSSLKAVLMSYAEIDDSLAEVWVAEDGQTT